jgi:spermidine synthase
VPGKVFVIDGIVQLTERDSFTFHEMMAHLPLFAHRDPKRVLIVGGGDGMILREVCRHKEVQQVIVVEIDPLVIQACKEHLRLAPADLFFDPRVEIILADAAEYLKDSTNRNKFDVILADTLDPLGPGESLFEPEFYESMYAALRPNGIACTQGENMWIHFDLVRDLVACCADIFDRAEYATTSVPSYPCGQIGFVLARKGSDKSCSVPVRKITFQDELKWYNPQMHRAAFVLPHYIKTELNAPDIELNGVENGNHDDFDDDDDGDRCLFAGCTIQ